MKFLCSEIEIQTIGDDSFEKIPTENATLSIKDESNRSLFFRYEVKAETTELYVFPTNEAISKIIVNENQITLGTEEAPAIVTRDFNEGFYTLTITWFSNELLV